jgi:hypothetical protein
MVDGPRRDPRGQLIRPYAVTRGRTEPTRDIAIEAILVTTPRGRQEAAFAGRDKQMIADLCDGRALSLAEIASHLRVPLGVARVLVADMATEGMLTLHETNVSEGYEERMELLERVLSGLRKL